MMAGETGLERALAFELRETFRVRHTAAISLIPSP